MSDVIVIGGGAAGLMAAYSAALCGHNVKLIEQNEKLGKKIYITGKGRCNFTNACDISDFFKNIVHNEKFMYSALYTFSNDMTLDFFEQNGMKYKIERGNRAFPESDKASDVTKTLLSAIRSLGVSVLLNSKVENLIIDNKKVNGVVLTSKEKIYADAVIVATGGFSYQTTGSTGDGYKFAKSCGHTVSKINPALVPLECSEGYIRDMQGLSLKNVSLKLKNKDGKIIYDDFGEMLFTHFGISGPLVLSASSYVGDDLRNEGSLPGEIDLKPALSNEQLDARLLRIIGDNKNKQFKSIFTGLLPAKMIPVICDLLPIDSEKQLNSVTKDERETVIKYLKHFPLTVSGTRGFNEAIITSGGVNVSEVNPSTMESKLIKGLFFAGEVIDVDALTGGFNLQIAFSTGYLAGINV